MPTALPAGIIFDMDGVLIDSERIWHQVENGYLKSIAPRYRDTDFKQVIGIRLADLHHLMCEHFGATITWEAFRHHYDEVGQDIYQNRTQLFTGVKETLTRLKQAQLSLGLASSSRPAWIATTLDRFELRPLFDAIVSGDEVPQGKPAPDVYTRAVEILDLSCKQCWAMEDADVGVLAAKRAGLWTIGFRNGHNHDQTLAEADHIITAFSDILSLIDLE